MSHDTTITVVNKRGMDRMCNPINEERYGDRTDENYGAGDGTDWKLS